MAAGNRAGKGWEDAKLFRSRLLVWYDRHRRVLPWRSPEGELADPYRVWLSEIMLQQTTVGAVGPYFIKFIEAWPTVQDLANAPEEAVMAAWAGLGYYSRARNLHKCAKVITAEYGGVFPDDLGRLKALPGVGDYTAAAITAIAFGKPATVIDGNVERVIARYYAIQEALPPAKKIIREKAEALSEGRTDRPGDFAQAMMDLGATICIAKTPRCGLCPLSNGCKALKLNVQTDLPRRAVKKPRPKRVGYAYWIEDGHGRVLLCRRPRRGLLGGMAALPSSDWIDAASASTLTHPQFILDLCKDGLVLTPEKAVHHIFTHFELKLIPVKAVCNYTSLSSEFHWTDVNQIHISGLPTVFDKVVKIVKT